MGLEIYRGLVEKQVYDPINEEAGWGGSRLGISEKRLIFKFFKAGFGKKPLISGSAWEWGELAKQSSSKLFTQKLLSFVSATLEEPRAKRRFVEELLSGASQSIGYFSTKDYLTSLKKLMRKSQKMPGLKKEFEKFAKRAASKDIEDFSLSLHIGSIIIQNQTLFSLFKNRPEKIITFVKKFNSDADQLLENLGQLVSSFNARFLLEGLSGSFLLDDDGEFFSESLGLDLSKVLSNKEACKLLNYCLKGKRTWPDRILLFPGILEACGQPFVTEKLLVKKLLQEYTKRLSRSKRTAYSKLNAEEKYRLIWNLKKEKGPNGLLRLKRKIKNSEKVSQKERFWGLSANELKRIQRRENENHPLNTLGIAKTVGFEIEYPNNTKLVRKLEKSEFSNLCTAIGFAEGGGGVNCDEISPGPFWDPLTANLVFGLYVDAGIIDLDNYEGMTMHFNVGLRGENGLVQLIRSMYLTGAGYDPDHLSEKSSLVFNNKRQKSNNYYEAKVFDVMERKDFEWNMRCVSYLSWALGIHNTGVIRFESGYKWKNNLSQIWKDYSQIMKEGATSVGVLQYLENNSNGTPAVQNVHSLLGQIFPDPSSRYRDPDLYKSKKLGPVSIGKSLAVEAGFTRNSWPNLVSFAREVTENAVQKIEAIADGVEKEVVQDIERINLARGERRKKLIWEFLKKYNTNGKKRLTEKEIFTSYKKVVQILKDF